MDMEAEPWEELTITLPPASKQRGDRVCDFFGRTLSHIVRDLPAGLEAGTLKRLPSDEARELYLKDRLRWPRAFPGKPEPRKGQFKFPDPPSGPHQNITIRINDTGREALDRYCKLFRLTKGFVLARFFNNLEKGILKGKDDGWRKRYFDGEFKKPRRPGPAGEPIVIEEPVSAE